MAKVDTNLFQAEGAFVNWAVVARRLELPETTAARPATLQLRWMLEKSMGLPTEPFIVWRRKKGVHKPQPIPFTNSPFIGGSRVISWSGVMSRVEVDVEGVAGTITAWVGAPWIFNTVGFVACPGGPFTVTISASTMDGLQVTAGVVVKAIRTVPTELYSQESGWEKLELVGLPVDKAKWGNVAQVAAPQGMVTALTTPQNAAMQRLERGAPPIGWALNMAAGFPAPVWSAPNFSQLIKDVNTEMLDDFQPLAAATPPNQHWLQKVSIVVPPPQNSAGKKMSGPSRSTPAAPWPATLLGAGSDPFLALSLGFGTAYLQIQTSTGASSNDALSYDYMITARWEKGLDGKSAAIEYAAIVPSPAAGIAPPVPSNVISSFLGHLQPLTRDAAWRCSVRVKWDRPFPISIFLPRTFAFAGTSTSPAAPVRAIMPVRNSGGFAPHIINQAKVVGDPEPNRISTVDRELPIPTNPGNRSMLYGVAHQDLYGQWSLWKTVNQSANQPDVDRVRIVSAEIPLQVPASGDVCDGSLVIEFLWDWSVRSPNLIRFGGRLYAAVHRGDPPPDTSTPTGLPRSLNGAEGFAVVTFAGNIPSVAGGATIIGLNPAGDAQVAFGPAQGEETRRYRLTIPGYKLNFATTNHIGLALWAQAKEQVVVQRTGAWSEKPSVISVSDPRPPVIPPDIVSLGSLPDASGESHVRLSWGNSSAIGYFIYESTETKILQANNLTEPTPDMTLSDRLTRVLNAFDKKPSRREFTRRNAKLITGNSVDLTLPRGSTTIHVFLVLGVSGGQVEAKWPSGLTPSDQLMAFAAPRLAPPSAPVIEVRPFVDNAGTHRARIFLQTRTGPRVKRLDLHRVRVDDAAKELDTMGPPILTIDSSTPAWDVDTSTGALGLHVERAEGVDSPPGSWKRVWYRATAWSDPDDLRGMLGDRSPASTTAWTVVPPAGPPPLSALTVDWPSGGAPGDVLITWTSTAPVRKTPLGPHTISVRASVVGAPVSVPPLIDLNTVSLEDLDNALPPSGSGVSRSNVPPKTPVPYSAIIRRADANDRVQFSLRVTDPLGRTSEKLLSIASGPILPAPEITDFSLKKNPAPATGLLLLFNSTAPLKSPAAGDYRLRVTVVRPPAQGQIKPPPPIILEMGMDDIPEDEPGPIPAGNDPVRLRRNPGRGPVFPYYVFSRVPVTQFVLRLTSPDGRSFQHTEVVP